MNKPTDKPIRFGPYHLGRDWLKDIEERGKRLELACSGVKPEPYQIKLPFKKG